MNNYHSACAPKEPLRNKKKGLYVNLTLDGLNVIVKLNFSENYSLEIESQDTQDILYELEEEEDITSAEEVARAITKVRDTLERLYYYKPAGKYLLKDDKSQVLIYKVFRNFIFLLDFK